MERLSVISVPCLQSRSTSGAEHSNCSSTSKKPVKSGPTTASATAYISSSYKRGFGKSNSKTTATGFADSPCPLRSHLYGSDRAFSKRRNNDRKTSRLYCIGKDKTGGESESSSAAPASKASSEDSSSRGAGSSETDLPSSLPSQTQVPAPPPHRDPNRRTSKNSEPQKPSVLQMVWTWLCSLMRPGLWIRFITQLIFFFGILRLNGVIVGPRTNLGPQRVQQQVPYSTFVKQVNKNQVQRVVIDSYQISWEPKESRRRGGVQITTTEQSRNGGVYAAGGSSGAAVYDEQAAPVHFSTTRPPDMATPYERLMSNGVEFGTPDRRGGNKVITVMLTMLYITVILGILGRLPFPFMKAFGQGVGMGRQVKKNGKGSGEIETQVRFSDVAGVDEAKEELQEVVEYLRHPEKFTRLGARPPTGVLLVGAPGTGKTLLAKAVAGEADVPFISVSASEFVELYVGMGAARVRDVFAKAKAQAPAIVFIDELDAVGKGRSGGRFQGVASDEREQTLNQLLTELDGFETGKLVICLAATNRPDTLDSALRRPGRFDRIVSVERPDKQGRKEILDVHISNRAMPLAPDVDLDVLSTTTVGFTGAELANLVNEAALLAGRRSQEIVDQAAFEEAIMRVVGGVEKKRSLLSDKEKEIIAFHEAGHALVGSAVARIVDTSPRVSKMSIMSRSGGALGYTVFPPNDNVLMFANDVAGRLVTLMGGRAAEEFACGKVSSGAVDDIQTATDLAYKAVAEYGLSPSIGPVSLQALADGKGGGDMVGMLREKGGEMSVAAEAEVRGLLNTALSTAADVLKTNPDMLNELTRQLVKEETLQGAALEKLLAPVVVPDSLRKFVSATAVTSQPRKSW